MPGPDVSNLVPDDLLQFLEKQGAMFHEGGEDVEVASMLQVLRARLTQHSSAAAAVASGGGAGPALEATSEVELYATIQSLEARIDNISRQVEDADHETLGLLQETLPMLISSTTAPPPPSQQGPVQSAGVTHSDRAANPDQAPSG